MGPLSKYRIVDFTQAWAGPVGSMMLADLGAEVVKIEPPDVGDHVRMWTRADLHGMSPYFLSANRNKRSVVIDLKDPAGMALAADLCARADAVMENFRPGVMERLGLGYEALRARNPGRVYCAMSGYGATGPYADRAAYDLLIQGEGGLMSVTGQANGDMAKVGVPVVDVMAGMVAGFSVLGALVGRDQSGVGQRIDLSMLEVSSIAMATLLVDHDISGRKAKPMGTGNQLLAPYQAFPTRTTPVVLGILTEGHWRLFCEKLGIPDLADDPRFKTSPMRVENREALNDIIIPILKQRSADEWIAFGTAAGLACGHVNDVAALSRHPQHLARDFFRNWTVGGHEVRVPGAAWRVGPARTAEEERPPPLLGEHSAEVLREWLDLPAEEIDRLIAARVVRPLGDATPGGH